MPTEEVHELLVPCIKCHILSFPINFHVDRGEEVDYYRF